MRRKHLQLVTELVCFVMVIFLVVIAMSLVEPCPGYSQGVCP